ncbi:Deoxycytidine triphosphate deaminase [compost metagenome]
MIINGISLLDAAPIKDMVDGKMVGKGGTSFGLGEAGYDLRIRQTVRFRPGHTPGTFTVELFGDSMADRLSIKDGRFALASAIEEFNMPEDLVGVVHDKSTWARRGLSVFNTVIENGWKGFLTLELVYHGQNELIIPAGSGIAQVMFHRTAQPARYNGRYQNQEDRPVPAIAAEVGMTGYDQ